MGSKPACLNGGIRKLPGGEKYKKERKTERKTLEIAYRGK